MQQLIEILNKVFKHKHTGTYLEIGSYDGVTDNVTHFFYQHGWRGICVEPQTKYFKMGVASRPGDLWVKGVVVSKTYSSKRVTFYECPDGRLSSINKSSAIHGVWEADKASKGDSICGLSGLSPGMKKKQLRAIKINRDIPRGCFDGGLDLLVINTGDDDFEIMQSIDLGLWKPRIVAVPVGYVADTGIRHMQNMGYYHLATTKTGDWLVFSNNIEDRANAL